MERLPFEVGASTAIPRKHLSHNQPDDSDCSEYFRPFTLDFQQHSVSRKCVYPHGT